MGNTALSNASNPQYPTLRALTLVEAEKQSNDKLVYPRISHDLPHHILERKLTPSSGRFSSSYRIRHQETGSVMVLKVFLVRDATLHQKEILQYQQELRQLNSYEFQQQGHLAPFQAWKMGGFYVQNTLFCPIYLVRPHLYSTMANRIVSRPFLAKEEKFFIAHQILKTIQFLHSKGICHGHLSSENIGLTSWNWVVLLDIMPQSHDDNNTVTNTNSSDTKSRLIRPVALAEDDPSDWVYFFQEHFSVGTPAASVTTTTNVSTEGSSYHRNGSTSSGGEKKCYVAPERFVKKDITTNNNKDINRLEELDDLNNTTDNSELNTEPKGLVLNPAMDIFSLGCVLMELFLNGEIAIDLGDLMEYKRSNGNLDTHSTLLQRLKKIESSSVRAACKHMLHLDPSRRLSAGEYLNRLLEDDSKIGEMEHTNVAPIPACHESIFFPLFKKVKNEVLSADARIALAAIHYKQIIQETVGIMDPQNSDFFSDIVGPTMMRLFDKGEKLTTQESSNQEAETINPLKHKDPNTADSLLAETERLLRQIEQNFSSQSGTQTEEKEVKIEKEESNYIFSPRAFSNTGTSVKPSAAALILFVQYVLVTIRHTQRPSSKIVGLQLLLSCATYCTDEVRLQRIIPSVVSLLHDSDACVRALSISTLSKVMGMVEEFPPSDAQIFPQYILKRISHLVTDSNLIVRLAFTESIADLAETALRFLDTCHVIKVYESAEGDTESTQDSASKAVESAEKAFDDTAADLLTEAIDFDNKEERTIATSSHETTVFKSKRDRKKMFQKSSMKSESLIRSNYDQDLVVLQDIVAKWLITITTDTSDSSTVLKIAVLENISQLCQFFGSEGVMVCILPQILAFLNNRKDWLLRATLCHHLPSVCVVVGRAATEQFVLPCVETALIDDEDLVVANALNCLASLVDIGLLSQIALFGTTMRSSSGNDSFGMLQKYSILLLHPSKDIQNAACALFSACCRTIGFPDDTAFIHPLMQPFLKTSMERSSYFRTDDITSNLIPNLPQMVFDSSNSDISTAIDSYANENGLNSDNRSFILDKLSRYINARRKKKAYSNPIMKSTIRIFNHTIKEEQKEIATFLVPNQKFAEIFSSPLPVWYDELREKSITSSFSGSAMATLRTMSLLSKVYGLTIMQPEHSTQPHYMLKGDMLKLDLGFDSFHEDDKNSVNMEMQRLVSSDEAKVFISATKGEWGALSMVDQTSSDINQLVSTLGSVDTPTLPPSLGPLQDIDGRFYSSHIPVLPQAKSSSDSNRRIFEWKPKVDVLTCTSMPGEHSGPISRLGISQDQSFFVSGSHDGTCKVFETRQMQENAGELKSCCTYDGNFEKSLSFSRVNDLTVVENSHSIASAHSNGSVHVWRVDMVGKEATGTTVAQGVSTRSSRVSGLTDIRTLDSIEGEILSISHFNTNSASIVTYSSQMGKIHSWDLRCSREPFTLSTHPEMGTLTNMSIGSDRNWMVAGTNSGYLTLWDLRFHKVVKAWQHNSCSPIFKVSTSFAALGRDHEPQPHVIMSCGNNETSIFNVITGECNHCFRVLDPSMCYADRRMLPEDYTSLPV